MKIFHETFVRFLLLNGYSQENVGLIYGKLGMSLSLFEISHLYYDDGVEDYAYDLLQEVLASYTKNCSFNNGKAGIAWDILYLRNNQYIDVDYRELYASEHDSIIEFIKKTVAFSASTRLQSVSLQ